MLPLSTLRLKRLAYSLDAFVVFSVAASAVFFALFLLLPVFSTIVVALVEGGQVTLKYFVSTLRDPEYVRVPPLLEVVRVEPVYRFVNGSLVVSGYVVSIGRYGPDFGKLLNSLVVSTFTTIFATALGVATAFAMARYRFPGKSVFLSLIHI